MMNVFNKQRRRLATTAATTTTVPKEPIQKSSTVGSETSISSDTEVSTTTAPTPASGSTSSHLGTVEAGAAATATTIADVAAAIQTAALRQRRQRQLHSLAQRPAEKIVLDNRTAEAMRLAIRKNDVPTVRHILSNFGGSGHYIEVVLNENDLTALHLACYCGQMDIVVCLVEEFGAQINVVNTQDRTPLEKAIRHGYHNIVRYLTSILQADAQHAEAIQALHKAIRAGDLTTVQHVLSSYNENVDVLVEATDNGGWTALHIACAYKSVPMVQYLVESCRANIDAVDKDGWTALHVASSNNRVDIVQYLVESCGVNVGRAVVVTTGNSALHIASTNGSVDVVRYLMDSCHVNVEAKNAKGWTALHLASRYGHAPLVQCLIQDYGANAEARTDRDGRTALDLAKRHGNDTVLAYFDRQHTISIQALHTAVRNQDVATVQDLVERRGANVQAKDSGGWTALHVASAQHSAVAMVQYLVEHCQAALDATDQDGWTPLYVACANNRYDIVRYYVESCQISAKVVSPSVTDKATPLHVASAHGSLEVAQYLIQTCDVNIEAKNAAGCTALHVACQFGHLALVQCLVRDLGANIHAVNLQVQTPLEVAEIQGHEIVALFLRARLRGNVQVGTSSTSTAAAAAITNNTTMATKNAAPQSSPRLANEPEIRVATGSTIVPLPTAVSPSGLSVEQARIKEAVAGTGETMAVSERYIQSILTPKVLGQGFFGTVYKGYDGDLGCTFAIKSINTEILAGGNIVDVQRAKITFEQEQQTLSHFRHPNIVSLFAYSFPDDIWGNYYLVYEIAEKGALDSFWSDDLKRLRLTFQRRVQIALDIMTALRFLHVGIPNKNISSCFHRDIKSANIVLKQDLTAQLIDCGLAKFVVDEVETHSSGSRKGTAGYICPEYSLGGVPFDCACDVYSFGVVLLELWTGRLQNHKDEDGNLFNFVIQYVSGRKGPKRDVKMDLDPTLGYDPSDVPDYMTRFVDLALSCMDEHDEIPSGEVVINELVDVLHACTAEEEYAVVAEAVNDTPVPQALGLQLCDRCLSFPKALNESYCRPCCDAEQQRNDIQEILSRLRTIGTETSAANSKLDAMAPILGNLDARISSTIPRLFFIVPGAQKSALRHPREYLRSKFATKYYLYFVCSHTGAPIEAPIKIVLNKSWVEKVSPVLAISLRLLQVGLGTVGVHLLLDGLRFHLTTDGVRDMLSEVTSMMGSSSMDLVTPAANKGPLDVRTVPELSGDVYDHVVEKATEQRAWRKLMEPVRTMTNPATTWVSKEVASNPIYGYIKAG